MNDRARAPEALATPRLLGRRVGPDELSALQLFHDDPEVARRLRPGRDPWTPAEVEALLERAVRHWEDHGFGLWTFYEKGTGAFVGRAGLRVYDLEGRRETELLYGVVSRLWRQGFATEMARASVDVARDALALPSLIALTLPSAVESQRVLTKCGFEVVGEIDHAGLPHLLHRVDLEPEGRAPVPAHPIRTG